MEWIRRAEDLAWRNVAGETIVVHLSRKRMYGLNAAGGRIWNALDQSVTITDLERLILSDAGDREIVRSSLTGFLADLAGEGLIEFDGAAPSASDATEGPAAPRIEWREEIRKFAGDCQLYPGVSVICAQFPQHS